MEVFPDCLPPPSARRYQEVNTWGEVCNPLALYPAVFPEQSPFTVADDDES
jgi:hypothetical protein